MIVQFDRIVFGELENLFSLQTFTSPWLTLNHKVNKKTIDTGPVYVSNEYMRLPYQARDIKSKFTKS